MWVFHFHRKYIESTFDSLDGPDAYKLAEERVKIYNEKNGTEVGKIEVAANGEIIVAVCDAFCRRVHKHVPQAGDIVLMDATSNLDRHDTKLFHLICPSAVGGLPLGNIITPKEDEETTCAALTLFPVVAVKFHNVYDYTIERHPWQVSENHKPRVYPSHVREIG